MEEAIEFGLIQLKYEHIRDNQKKAVFGYLNDMICYCVVQFLCSPTGSGKLLTFEIAPFVFSFMHHKDQLLKLTSSVIVISPLVSLMESQVLKTQITWFNCSLSTKYQGSRPCGFRQEDFFTFSCYKPI